jgi:hypothetical protein
MTELNKILDHFSMPPKEELKASWEEQATSWREQCNELREQLEKEINMKKYWRDYAAKVHAEKDYPLVVERDALRKQLEETTNLLRKIRSDIDEFFSKAEINRIGGEE